MPAVSRAQREEQERLLAAGFKACCTCKETKSTSEFGANASTCDGLQKQCTACRKAHYRKNPEKAIARAEAWKEANPERRREIALDYAKRNPERMAAQTRLKYARDRGLLPEEVEHSSEEREKILDLYREARRLTQETGVPHEVDHIRPIAAGGKHELTNLQIITAEENRRKNTSYRGKHHRNRDYQEVCRDE